MANSSNKVQILTDLLTCLETQANLETQYLALRQTFAEALADDTPPDKNLLCEFKLLAHDLKYQIMELRERIDALEKDLC